VNRFGWKQRGKFATYRRFYLHAPDPVRKDTGPRGPAATVSTRISEIHTCALAASQGRVPPLDGPGHVAFEFKVSSIHDLLVMETPPHPRTLQ